MQWDNFLLDRCSSLPSPWARDPGSIRELGGGDVRRVHDVDSVTVKWRVRTEPNGTSLYATGADRRVNERAESADRRVNILCAKLKKHVPKIERLVCITVGAEIDYHCNTGLNQWVPSSLEVVAFGSKRQVVYTYRAQ